MKRPLTVVLLADLVFFLLLVVSGSLTGIGSHVVYYLAFLIPIGIGIFAIRWGACRENREFLPLGGTKILPSLPLIFPTVAAVMLVSLLTSLVFGDKMTAFGTPEMGDSTPLAIFNHALVPAVLEEILFRYIPIKLLAGHSPRYAVLLSAIFFALVHHSFASIPYAFVAGIVLAAVSIAFESIYPAMIIHFINNLTSVLSLCYSDLGEYFGIALWGAVLLLAALSAVYLFIKRAEYTVPLRKAFAKGDGYDGGALPVMLIIPTAFVAVVELISVLCS